jgi:hypothetical protein
MTDAVELKRIGRPVEPHLDFILDLIRANRSAAEYTQGAAPRLPHMRADRSQGSWPDSMRSWAKRLSDNSLPRVIEPS